MSTNTCFIELAASDSQTLDFTYSQISALGHFYTRVDGTVQVVAQNNGDCGKWVQTAPNMFCVNLTGPGSGLDGSRQNVMNPWSIKATVDLQVEVPAEGLQFVQDLHFCVLVLGIRLKDPVVVCTLSKDATPGSTVVLSGSTTVPFTYEDVSLNLSGCMGDAPRKYIEDMENIKLNVSDVTVRFEKVDTP